eukprot:CAMPEP_0180145068 /NCGR_PEP_ID=MMETSP0986-20121125/17416_1 /TAXON_ID=697907 /ORGANISM="non described non described, Strain CCMP2293" /LENGTH=47 /DNA_ID= /DNA_START= /DNA_END= /DNA_ORIENTATION=
MDRVSHDDGGRPTRETSPHSSSSSSESPSADRAIATAMLSVQLRPLR